MTNTLRTVWLSEAVRFEASPSAAAGSMPHALEMLTSGVDAGWRATAVDPLSPWGGCFFGREQFAGEARRARDADDHHVNSQRAGRVEPPCDHNPGHVDGHDLRVVSQCKPHNFTSGPRGVRSTPTVYYLLELRYRSR